MADTSQLAQQRVSDSLAYALVIVQAHMTGNRVPIIVEVDSVRIVTRARMQPARLDDEDHVFLGQRGNPCSLTTFLNRVVVIWIILEHFTFLVVGVTDAELSPRGMSRWSPI